MLTFDKLKKQIFLSKENPTELASLLMKVFKADTTPTALTVSGSTSVKKDTTATYSTQAVNKFDVAISPTITYSLAASVTGCTVDSSTGVLTVDSTAIVGSKPKVTATSGSVSSTIEVTIIA